MINISKSHGSLGFLHFIHFFQYESIEWSISVCNQPNVTSFYRINELSSTCFSMLRDKSWDAHITRLIIIYYPDISYSHCCVREFKLVIVCMMDGIYIYMYINGFTISKSVSSFMRSYRYEITVTWQLWKVRAHTSFFLLALVVVFTWWISFRNSPCHACVVTNTKRQIKLWTKIYCIWSYCDVTVEYKKYISIYLYTYIYTYTHKRCCI